MPHTPEHLLDQPSLATVVRNGNSFSQAGGPTVTLASAQQSLGINPQLSGLSAVGNSPAELQNRSNTLNSIQAATDRIREGRLQRLANRPGIAGDAARNELQNLGVSPSIANASQINNFADTLAQQRQRESLVQSNLADARSRRSNQDFLLAKIQRAGFSDVEEDQRAGAIAAELLPNFTGQSSQLNIPQFQLQGLRDSDLLAAQQAEADRQTQLQIAQGRDQTGLAGAELEAASRLGVAELQNQGLARQAQLAGSRELAKAQIEDQVDAEKARRGALDTFNILDKLDALSGNTGPTANIFGALGGTPLGDIGIGSGSAKNKAEFNALSNNLVLAAASQLSGVLSDTDIKLLRETGAQFGNSPEANRAIIQNMRELITQRLGERGISLPTQQDQVENRGEQLRRQGLSDEQILERLQSEFPNFNLGN